MKISIAEGLYLIALDDKEGKLLSAAERAILPGIFSAVILELHILEKLDLDNNVLSVRNTEKVKNPVLDKVLSILQSGTDLTAAIEILISQYRDILKDMNQLLVERGILRKESTKLLWIPLSERMNNENYAYEQEIRNGMRIMVYKKAKPSPAFLVLMSLVYYCNLLEEVFPDKDDQVDAEKVARALIDSPVATPPITQALKTVAQYLKG